MSVTRILLVDDLLAWQCLIQILLEPETDLKIIAAATDGLEAVRRAKELLPDVVLMDVSLPGMNGFEATRQIRMNSPDSRILFLSEQRGRNFVEAAFSAGGSGYVLKSDSESDLLTGIRSVLRGQQFVSRSLAHFRDVSD